MSFKVGYSVIQCHSLTLQWCSPLFKSLYSEIRCYSMVSLNRHIVIQYVCTVRFSVGVQINIEEESGYVHCGFNNEEHWMSSSS